MATDVTTPIGRIVWGDVFKPRTVTDDNGTPKIGKDGNPRQQWSFGLAIPKDQFGEVWQAMNQEAAQGFPQGVPHKFAWKFKDGDTDLDAKGNPLNQKEGYAGCYVLACAQEFAPKVYQTSDGKQFVQMNEGVKTGDYVRVNVRFVAHAGQQPGLYVNPGMILFVQPGEAIQNGGGDPSAAFGGMVTQAAPQPAAATATPPMPGQGAPTPPMPGQAAPQPAAPAHDFVDNATGQAAPMPGMPGQQ